MDLPGCAHLAFADMSAHMETRADGSRVAPTWVHISPAGEENESGERVVRGRDGREFAILDPQRALAGTELPMQFDRDHESVIGGFLSAPNTRAAGWIDEVLYVAPGEEDDERPQAGFWGHVEAWTSEGRDDVEGLYYRGLSPVVRFEQREPEQEGDEAPAPVLVGFVNVALTNRPNLRMQMLHSERHQGAEAPQEQETPMAETNAELAELRAQLAKANAEKEAAHAAAEALRKKAQTDRIANMLDRHSERGVLPPAQRDFFARAAVGKTSIDDVESHLASLKVHPVTETHSQDGKNGSAPRITTLTESQKKAAEMTGFTQAEYLEILNKEIADGAN